MKVKKQIKSKRLNNRRWKGIYGTDRKYTARVDRAIARGQHTGKEQ